VKNHKETGWRRNSVKRKFSVEDEVQQKRQNAKKMNNEKDKHQRIVT